MPRETQNKILRVLVEQKFERVGGTKKVKVDVRVLSSTSVDVEARIAEGTFREDLFHRLAVVPVKVPGLADRRDDIPLLIEHFAEKIATEQGVSKKAFSKGALKLLKEYNWTGNIRELRNVIERLIILGEKEVSENDVKLFASK